MRKGIEMFCHLKECGILESIMDLSQNENIVIKCRLLGMEVFVLLSAGPDHQGLELVKHYKVISKLTRFLDIKPLNGGF